MKKAIFIFIIILTLTACTPKESQTTDEIRIGYIGALTGDVAVTGMNNMRGIQLAIDELNAQGGINGKKFRLIAEDDELQTQETFTSYKKLNQIDNVHAILSISYGGLISLAKTIDQDKKVVINSLDTTQELADAGEYLFGIGVLDDSYGNTLADFTYNNLKKKKVALVYNNQDPLFLFIKETFQKRFEALEGTIVIEEAYQFENLDFRTRLLKIKENNIDTVVVIGFDEAGFLLKNAKELELPFTFLGWDQFNTKGFKKNANGVAIGQYFTFWKSPNEERLQDFIKKFKDQYNEEPNNIVYAVTGYDAMHMLAQAMKIGVYEGESLKNALHNVKNYQGVSGNLSMGNDGIVRSIQMSMFQFNESLEPVFIA